MVSKAGAANSDGLSRSAWVLPLDQDAADQLGVEPGMLCRVTIQGEKMTARAVDPTYDRRVRETALAVLNTHHGSLHELADV